MKNNRIKNIQREMLSDNWYRLEKVTFEYLQQNGEWQTQTRESYDRGNGAVILLYDKSRNTVILVKQFRMPTYLNGNKDGFMIEACAGLLDKDNPEDCIRKEVEEETGYKIQEIQKIFESYMSPGSVTETLHFFTAEYTSEMKVSRGGGAKDEQENIEVLEIPFDDAYEMIAAGEIRDAKTIMLLQYLKLNKLIK